MTEKELKYHDAYLDMAKRWSLLSHAKRKKVGAIMVKGDQIISDGYNGTPAGMDNSCEDKKGETHWYVQHAEENAILKCAKNGNSAKGSTLYQTHSPCKQCSKLILSAGIERVIYMVQYKDSSGIDFLKENGVEVIQL